MMILMVYNNSWCCSFNHNAIDSTMRKGSISDDGDSTSSHGTANQSALKGIDHYYCPLIMIGDDDVGDALSEDDADGDVNAKRDGTIPYLSTVP
mmetsp:Transcript_5487/g.10583  ORF Transcript_5487/g.10583 Transcript_5487/m.10583 type:complete len:94 (+) Transcript_5487:872-1153(+)